MTVGHVVLLVSVLLGLSYLPLVERDPALGRTVVKTSAVGLLCIFAAMSGGPSALVAALALSAVGDAFLAHDGEGPFVCGLVSFLLAHLAFAYLFFQFGDLTLITEIGGRAGAAIMASGFAIAVVVLLWRPAEHLAPAVGLYTAAILTMALLALGMPRIQVFVAAALFMSSDAVIAVRAFLMRDGHPAGLVTGLYIWASYYTAQLVLTLLLVNL